MMDGITIGLQTYPLETNTGNPFLKDLDPCLYELMKFFEAIPNVLVLGKYKECIAKLTAKGQGGGVALADPNRLFQSVIPYPLTEQQIAQAQIAAPFMCCDKISSEIVTNANNKTVLQTNLMLVIVLPSMDVNQFAAFYPFLTVIPNAIDGVLLAGELDVVMSSASVLQSAGIERITTGQRQVGSFDSVSSGLFMPSVTMTFVIEERLDYDDSTVSNVPGVINIGYQLTSILDEELKMFDQTIDLSET